MLSLEKFTIGVGDRFAHQAATQLRAFQLAAQDGVEVVPVWNKSNREHTFIGSEPSSVLAAAQAAVKALGWNQGWHVDADHIRLETVDRFLPHADFFTIDFFAAGRGAAALLAATLRGADLLLAPAAAPFAAAFFLRGVFFAADFFAADLRVIAMRSFSCG